MTTPIRPVIQPGVGGVTEHHERPTRRQPHGDTNEDDETKDEEETPPGVGEHHVDVVA